MSYHVDKHSNKQTDKQIRSQTDTTENNTTLAALRCAGSNNNNNNNKVSRDIESVSDQNIYWSIVKK